MAFIRKIKKGNSTYLAKVESYREEGKVKQRVIEYIGTEVGGLPVTKVDFNSIEVDNVKRYADVTVLHQMAISLNLNYLLGKHHKSIIALVIAHILCKGSILRISKWLNQSTIKETLDLPELSIEMLYHALDHLEECNFTKIEQAIYENWIKMAPEDSKAFVLDVTDTYHNGKHIDSLPRRGKDGKISKLIQIGLAVSFGFGFPILHQTFEGNISNIKILENMMLELAKKGIRIIILDRGFYSEAKVTDMQKLGMKMIVGVKQSMGIKNQILNQVDRDNIYSKKHQVVLKNTTVYAMESDYLFGKIVVIYNPKYEALKRDKMLAENATQNEVKYVGYSLVFHNTGLRADAVVKKYFDKDIVERSFKSLKGEIQLHPIRLWLPTRINAHIKLCYLSMCILSLMQFRCRKLELSAEEILEEIETIYQVNLKHSATKKTLSKTVTQTKLQKDILKTLKCSV